MSEDFKKSSRFLNHNFWDRFDNVDSSKIPKQPKVLGTMRDDTCKHLKAKEPSPTSIMMGDEEVDISVNKSISFSTTADSDDDYEDDARSCVQDTKKHVKHIYPYEPTKIRTSESFNRWWGAVNELQQVDHDIVTDQEKTRKLQEADNSAQVITDADQEEEEKEANEYETDSIIGQQNPPCDGTARPMKSIQHRGRSALHDIEITDLTPMKHPTLSDDDDDDNDDEYEGGEETISEDNVSDDSFACDVGVIYEDTVDKSLFKRLLRADQSKRELVPKYITPNQHNHDDAEENNRYLSEFLQEHKDRDEAKNQSLEQQKSKPLKRKLETPKQCDTEGWWSVMRALKIKKCPMSSEEYAQKAELLLSTSDHRAANCENAVKCAIKAARGGHPLGEYLLGCAYRHGLGSKQVDFARAAHWLTKAALQGCEKASLNLGWLYERGGQSLVNSPTKAFWWYSKAHDLDPTNVNAIYAVGRCYRQSIGVPKDNFAARQLFMTATQLGHAKAQAEFGTMLMTGEGGEANEDMALEMWEEASALGVRQSATNLVIYDNNADTLPASKIKYESVL